MLGTALHNACSRNKVPEYTEISLHQSAQTDVDTGLETHLIIYNLE